MAGTMSWNQAMRYTFDDGMKIGSHYKAKLIRIWVKYGLRIDPEGE